MVEKRIDVLLKYTEQGQQTLLARTKQINSSLERVQKRATALSQATNKIRLFEKAGIDINQLNNVNGATREGRQLIQKMAGQLSQYNDKAAQSSKLTGKLTKGLLTAGLGMLFFGMAIKRFFTNIGKSLFATYLQVTDNTSIVTQKVNQLSAAFEFLKFSIVESLASSDLFLTLMDWIINITNAISTFIAKHPGLAKFILAFIGIGIVIGAVLMVLGQMLLGVLALVSAFTFLGSVISALALAGVLGTVGTVLLWIIGIVAALAIVFATNLGNIRGFFANTFGIIWESAKSMFKNLKDAFKGIWLFIKGILTGDFEMVWRGLMDFVTNILASLIKGWLSGFAVIANIVIFAMNLIKDVIASTITAAIGLIKALIKAWNKIPGFNISTDPVDALIDKVNELKEAMTLDYFSGEQIADALGVVDLLEDTANKWLGGSEAFEKGVSEVPQVVEDITEPEATTGFLSAQLPSITNIEINNELSGTVFGMDDFEEKVKDLTGQSVDELLENSTINVGTPNSPLGLD